ncbi:MAG TPA: phosphotransferase [Acidimicrobiales bacterium]|nr:phosphotransferase [Acidimicrobiales bacterium]
MRNIPEPDFRFNSNLVSRLIDDQYPILRERDPEHVGAGYDVEVWRISDDLVVRLPRRTSAFTFVEREIKHLPSIPQDLPLAIPCIEAVGVASVLLPGPWFVTQYLPGISGNVAPLAECVRGALDLGVTLASIHALSTENVDNVSARGVAIETRRSFFEKELDHLPNWAAKISQDYFDQATLAELESAKVFLHGDVHRSNLIVHDGRPTALIDFGDLGYGDSAGDLGGGIFTVGYGAHREFLTAYGSVSEATLTRALGWACYFAVRNFSVGDAYALEFLESLRS